MGFNDPQRKMIAGKPKWQVAMEIKALRQRWPMTDGQCAELLETMQEIIRTCPDPKYKIGATQAILAMQKMDQDAALANIKLNRELSDGIPEHELDDAIEGELANLADSPQAPPAGPNQGTESGEAAADAPDDPDDTPAGLS